MTQPHWTAATTITILAGLLAGCPSGGEGPGGDGLGSLRVAVSGLPADTTADLTVTGPEGYAQSISSTTTLEDVATGTYTVEAPDLTVGSDLYTSTVDPASAMVVKDELAIVSVTYLLEVVPGPSITDLVIQGYGSSTQVRQGTDSITVEITGEDLANTTIVRLGDLGGTIDDNNASSVIASFDLPPSIATGALDLEVVADAGMGTVGSAVSITATTAGGSGNDDTGRGTPDAPLRSLDTALAIAPPDGDIVLLAGTYDEANGEVWPVALEDRRVFGSGSDTTILMGSGSSTAVQLEGDTTLTDLQITNFSNGIRINGGNATLEGLDVWGNIADGLNGSASLTTPIETVDVRDSSFHDNGLNGFEAVTPADTPATYTLENLTLTDNGQRGLYVLQSAQVSLTGAAIEGNEFHGINLIQDATLTASDLTVRNNDLEGIDATGNTTLDLDDSLVRGNLRYGIEFAGASMTMRNSEVLNNVDGGVRISWSPVVDLGTTADPGNNTIGVDGAGISLGDYLRDDRSSNSTPTISAVGVDLGAAPAPTGLVTGPDGDTPFWSIDDAGNQIFFGN